VRTVSQLDCVTARQHGLLAARPGVFMRAGSEALRPLCRIPDREEMY
jgi:hypothetical protein